MFAAEWAYLRARRAQGPDRGPPLAAEPPARPDARLGLTGLALSGGGVRSAAFALGALQRLAYDGLLQRLDYLSTVSGGGFLGGALLAQLQNERLGPEPGRFPFRYATHFEPSAVRHFRRHSSYLAPRGLLSWATFELATIYLVGLVINVLSVWGWFALAVAGAMLAIDVLVMATEIVAWTGFWLVGSAATLDAASARETLRFWAPVGVGLLLVTFAARSRTLRSALARAAVERAERRRRATRALAGVAVFGGLVLLGEFMAWSRHHPEGLQALVARILAWEWATPVLATLPAMGWGARFLVERPRLAQRWLAVVLDVGGVLAGVGMAVGFAALLLRGSEWWVAGSWAQAWDGAYLWPRALLGGGLRLAYAGAAVLAAAALWRVVNPALWSPQQLYRDRLTEAFIVRDGTAHAPAPAHDLLLARVLPDGAAPPPPAESPEEACAQTPRLPYPIINATINLPESEDNLRRERGAELFQLAPRHCGSEATGYRPTARYAGGELDLATAVAASGAAVSPHMGEFTQPMLRLLIGFFNFRLGISLPNPGRAGWDRPLSGWRWIPEWLRRYHERTRRCEISDGGHFENLGLTALLRRRCRYIVCVDAEADPRRWFGGLSRAVRMARIDQRAHVVIDPSPVVPGPDGRSAACHVVGTIYYSGRNDPGDTGVLVYVKPSLTGVEPIDVRNYQLRHPDFPHQGTGDQFFDESQFEAYRELGYQCVRSTYKALAAHREQPERALNGVAAAGGDAPGDGAGDGAAAPGSRAATGAASPRRAPRRRR